MEVEQTGHQIIAALTPNAAGMQQSGMNMNSGMQQSGMYMNSGMQQSGMNMNSGMQQPGMNMNNGMQQSGMQMKQRNAAARQFMEMSVRCREYRKVLRILWSAKTILSDDRQSGQNCSLCL